MPPQAITAKLTRRIPLTDDVYELQFQLLKPEEISFIAGQFVTIKVEDGNPKLFFRSYSIMSPPSQKKIISTCIKLVPAGRATPWLTTVSEGTDISMMGPLGKFVFHESPNKRSIFVATGTGITPLRCMIEDQLEKGNTTDMHLIWGFRFEKDIFYTEELDNLHTQYPNFTYTITVSRPEEEWKGSRGRVTDWLKANIATPAQTQVYICGVGDMVTDTATICEEIGMAKEDIHFEKYA
ncbi:MAG: FAD-dependent oxidoreductase [Candidatus Peregrinibacteria bacterium]|nr:FAD-dependent oxidoreductase [Candidatus Peregrinibacteria bacterium]